MKRREKGEKPRNIVADDPAERRGVLKRIGGSKSDTWNNEIANQVVRSLNFLTADEGERDRLTRAAVAGLMGIEPRDEMEGMLAAQLIAVSSAAMECYRRAAIAEYAFERQESLNQANKLSRTYALLVEALDHHRGKGQQRVTVEHVHVHSGGQAIVGNVAPGGSIEKEEQPNATQKGTRIAQDGSPFRPPAPRIPEQAVRRSEGQHQRAKARALQREVGVIQARDKNIAATIQRSD